MGPLSKPADILDRWQVFTDCISLVINDYKHEPFYFHFLFTIVYKMLFKNVEPTLKSEDFGLLYRYHQPLF